MITCFDIGGSAIKCAVAAADGQIGELQRVPTPTHDFSAFTAAMQTLVAAGGPSLGVAISIAGVVDPADGRIKCANIPCIDGRMLADDLAEVFGLPVWIINDADSFALAEAQAGAARGHANVFGLILGTGVGGGLVIGGRLIGGPGGFAGEWGHGPVAAQFAGTPPQAIPRFRCGCGQTGCLDTVGGARGLERLHLTLHQASLDSRAIIAAWQAGDADAELTISCFVDLLSGPLAMLVNTFGASILPVGGGLANSAPLIARLDDAVRAAILRKTDAPIIVPGQSGAEPGLIGAAWLGLNKLESAHG
ncbi:ROK family protein [Pseudoduganella sp. FT26W]|uniref:ROK family protein n=1 Tax=Duganella aquatilis TaxID=2666082 RepID=A0A844CQ34_9BURK|nr:ROK family protein [Duganella aquatilis]MRW82827.1 ROK family protein [Duganella aquatilis]